MVELMLRSPLPLGLCLEGAQARDCQLGWVSHPLRYRSAKCCPFVSEVHHFRRIIGGAGSTGYLPALCPKAGRQNGLENA